MSRHIIHQQAVEINATHRNTAQPLFLEISRLFNNRAKDVAGYVLDKYDRDNELIKIDLLEIDIGVIPFPFSEESFVKIYSEKLEEALSGTIKRQLQLAQSSVHQSDVPVAKRSLLYLLEQFLLTGTIAWWAGKEELKDPILVFKALQEKEMPLLRALITRLFPEETVRKRLVYAFTEENTKTVIGMIQPTEKEFIVRYHSKVTSLQAENNFVRTDSTGFAKVLWLFILDFLADHSGNRFNRKMFVRSTLKAIALRFNVRFEELLFFFSEALKDIPENYRRKENLLGLVEEIVLEESQQLYAQVFNQSEVSRDTAKTQELQQLRAKAFSQPDLSDGPENSQESQKLSTRAFAPPGLGDHSEHTQIETTAQALFFFLLNGFFPVGFQSTDGTSLNTDLMHAIQHNRTYARLFFLKHGRSDLTRKRLLTHFSDASVKALVQFVEPVGSELISSYASFIIHFQNKVHFVKTEESLFRHTVWDLILTGVFSGRGSGFHAKSFLVENLRALAQHYQMDPVRLQAILVQETVRQDSTITTQTTLFALLTEILSENTVAKHTQDQASLLRATGVVNKDDSPNEDSPINVPEKEFPLPETKESSSLSVPGKQLWLSEILDGAASTIAAEQKSFLLHVVLHVLEFGMLPPWADSGDLSVPSFISRMRASYPKELKKGLVYAARTGKAGVSFLHQHAPLFKSDLVFLFEDLVPEKLLLFFQELQAFHMMADVLFAQALLTTLAEGTDRTPELPVFFSVLLKHTERTQGKEAAKTLSFGAGKFSSLKGSRLLQQAFDTAIKEQAYTGIPSNMGYSSENFKQALAISFSPGKVLGENELRDELYKWIKHYARYQKLPSEIKLPDLLSGKKLIAWSLEFLFRNHTSQLEELFSAAQLHANEQLLFSELLQSTGTGLQVRYFVEAQSRRHFLARETELVTFGQDNPGSWKWLIKKLAGLPPGDKTRVKLAALLNQESSRTLIALYISDDELKLVFEKSPLPDLWLWYQHFQEVGLVIASGHFERRHFRKRLVEFFLAVCIGHIPVQRSAKELSGRFAGFMLSKPDDVMAAIREKLLKPKTMKGAAFSANAKELMKHLSSAMNTALQRSSITKAIEEELSALEEDLHFSPDDGEKKQLQEERHEKTADAKELQKGKTLAPGEQVYVRNAGMILLHPFLATLFARAELVKDGLFAGEAAQAKAVQLLQYAVTGAEQEPEYELVLNKLLTGLKPEEVLIHTLDLETKDKELVNGMVNAIIMQWDKMKNTSLEGFRNSFLMREGYIFQTEENWVLRVEQRGYDIILQTLPWSFGMIKFSWMNKPLIVEWN